MDVKSVNGVNSAEVYSKSVENTTAKNESNQENDEKSREEYEKSVQKAVDKVNKFLEDEGTYAKLTAHDKFKNEIIVTIIDKKTNEVVMQVPSKKILDMVAKMCEMAGVIFDKKA